MKNIQMTNFVPMQNMTVILADGDFPVHPVPLGYLKTAERIICCDGSASKLIDSGMLPTAIVGDLDSLEPIIREKYSDRLFKDNDQETNDLTKAVRWCLNREFKNLVILGATGKREDHTLGNISLLVEYAAEADVVIVTDTGVFRPVTDSSSFDSFRGQQVSVFSINPDIEITSRGLKYPLAGRKLTNWWMATLNEALGNSFSLEFEGTTLIVYQAFPPGL